MDDPVIRTMPLGFPWVTEDPFLFCVHHVDHYPAANEHMGPVASLEARDIGMDFSGADGWSMYHGSTVPGFPQHPHRGFETVTFMRQGTIDHSDSLGATARFGRGDAQWLTAGRGIVHCEMMPLLDRAGPNPSELFQIWLNLPASHKMVDPYFTMFWRGELPQVVAKDDAGRTVEVTVVAGRFGDVVPLPPPPDSWASRPDSEVAIWQARFEPDAQLALPATAHPETVRTMYVFAGTVAVGESELPAPVGAVLRSDAPVEVTAGSQGAEILILQGTPIGEPVAQYGPFVMNDQAGIEQAFSDYRRTGFGGWPWPTDDPVHPADSGRFAIHPDGRPEYPDSEVAV
jgi:redox-sensitive bicupin YhaK (pirin superfamily)